MDKEIYAAMIEATRFTREGRLAGALIDRLTHHVHVVEIEEDSYRLQASLKAKRGGSVPKTPRT